VTATQAARFLNAQGHNECYGPDARFLRVCVAKVDGARLDVVRKDNTAYVAVPGSEERPAMFTIEGALRYCAWVGKQIPSEAQWEYAARHDPRTGRDYAFAWGDEWDPDRAYIEDDHSGPFLPGSAMPVGSFDGSGGANDGSSPWGLHDVVGNVEEFSVRCATSDSGCRPGCSCPVVAHGTRIAGKPLTRRNEVSPDSTGFFTGLRCARPAP
jgi:formylglycine-generating enzyme required for sulfatase activity